MATNEMTYNEILEKNNGARAQSCEKLEFTICKKIYAFNIWLLPYYGVIGIESIGGKNLSKTPKTKEPSHQKAMTTIRRQKERNTHFTK